MDRIKVGLPDDIRALADQQRGLVPLATWIRDLVIREVTRPGLTADDIGAPTSPPHTRGHVMVAQTQKVSERARPQPPQPDPKHRHRYDKTSETRPKANGRGVEHEYVCGGCFDVKWED